MISEPVGVSKVEECHTLVDVYIIGHVMSSTLPGPLPLVYSIAKTGTSTQFHCIHSLGCLRTARTGRLTYMSMNALLNLVEDQIANFD